MKPRPVVSTRFVRGALVALAFMLPFVRSVQGQSPETGAVTGSVSNAATRSFLVGAAVSLAGTTHATLTDRDGTFAITGVPPGSYTLEVSYTGLDRYTQPVDVRPGRNVVAPVGLKSEIYQLDVFTVSGEREGSAAAITRQRNADNVKSVLATDSFGELVDGNIGEMLKRVSGIATNLNEGEVDQIFVRGMGSAYSSVTLDGTRLPSPAKGKKERNFEVDKLPADYIESIEVIKAPTPDMDADSVGGTVNLITKSAFSSAGRRLSYSSGVNYKTLRHLSSFFGGVQYSDVFGAKKNLGVYLSVAYSDNYVPQDVTQLDFERASVSPAYLWRFRLEDAVHLRNRTNLGLKFDYRYDEKTTLFAGVMFTHYTDTVDQKRLTIQNAENRTAYAPGYTEMVWEQLNSTWTYQVSYIEPRQETYAWQIGGKTNLPGLRLDYGASYAPGFGEERRANFDLALAGQRTRFDRSADVWYPIYTNLTPGDPNDYNRYNRGRMQAASGRTDEAIWGGELNARKDFPTKHPFSLKAGGRYRAQKTEVDNEQTTSIYVGPNGVQGGGDDNLNQFKLSNYTHHGFSGRYNQAEWPDAPKAYWSFLNQRNLWDDDLVGTTRESFNSDGRAREDVYAAYAMGTVDLGKLRLLSGVRAERTDVAATGVLNRPILPALPSSVPEQQRADRAASEYHRVTKKSRYTDYFPGVHLRFAPRRDLLLRASYTTSFARPNFGDLMPDTNVNDTNLTVSQNNTALKPQHADNFDVSAEFYFEPSGLFSLGAFRKNIRDFIFTDSRTIGSGADNGFDGQYGGYLLSTRKNGGTAMAQGIEFSYNQRLVFLPAWLRGMSAYATYTLIDSKGNYNSNGLQSDDQLVQFVPEAWNFGLTYQQYRWTIRAQFNYNDRFLNAYTANPAERIYDDERIDGALNVKYQFHKRLSVYCDWTNALDQTVVRVQGKDFYRPQKIRYNGMRFNIGVSGNF
ncbi:MAG: TonB-dependent receptor [Opitutaceae bacterium]|nr:TonB-dependent receptor [Opitutaceae bacterium]